MRNIKEDICPRCGSHKTRTFGKDGMHLEDTEVVIRTYCSNCNFTYFQEYSYKFRNIRYLDKEKDMYIELEATKEEEAVNA